MVVREVGVVRELRVAGGRGVVGRRGARECPDIDCQIIPVREWPDIDCQIIPAEQGSDRHDVKNS